MNHGHLSDDELELYCLGRLPVPATARVEEHLLLCRHCQGRCEGWQGYLDALRLVLRSQNPSANIH